jgi:hypothetical protein
MFRKVVVSLWLLAFPTIAMAATRVDLDRHKDFSRYKTFTLEVAPPIRADGVVDEQNTLAQNRLRQAVTREFQTRGLEATDSGADLTVRVSSRETERAVVLGSGWGGYPRGWYRRWGYWGRPGFWGPYASDVWTRRYLEGSVIIDVIERDTGNLVYRAQVTDEIGKDLDKQANKIADKALKKFPIEEIS